MGLGVGGGVNVAAGVGEAVGMADGVEVADGVGVADEVGVGEGVGVAADVASGSPRVRRGSATYVTQLSSAAVRAVAPNGASTSSKRAGLPSCVVPP